MMDQVMMWIGPATDVAMIVLLALVLWRLGHDPGTAWNEREVRLKAIFDDLRALVAQSEGLARDLDEKLAGREARLGALLAEAQAALVAVEPGLSERAPHVGVRDEVSAAKAPAAEKAVADPAALASRIEALADDGTTVEEIARRVGVAAAEVRLVIGLKAARVARRRAAASEGRLHA
jgi:hypothetical protein